MKWGILGALDAEVALILERLEEASTVQMLGTSFHCGRIGRTSVVVACCNPGTINAAVSAAALIERFGVECIINVGIAGAMDPKLRLLDVVISDRVILHDRDEILKKYYPFSLEFSANNGLIALCTSACDHLSSRRFTYHVGPVASGDWFIADQQSKDQIWQKHRPYCVEMEGAAIGQTCAMYDIPFLVIRSLSDAADDNAAASYDNLLHTAAQQSAQIVLGMLDLV